MNEKNRFRHSIAHSAASMAAALMCLSLNGVSNAQSYPAKPIRIVTAPAGGANDFVARMLGPGMTESLGQQVIVDNRPAGVIPGQIVSEALPDGYTLLATTGILWILPFMQKTPFDPVRDFSPVTQAVSYPNILVVPSTSTISSVKELIALAKAKPGELNYGSGAAGSNTHLTAELFKAMASVSLVRIPYKGEGPAVIGLLSGQVQVVFASGGALLAHIKSGRLKVLAVCSAQPSALVPGVPTVAASGVPGFESVTVIGFLAPAKTPAAIMGRLNKEMAQILRKSDVKEKFFNAGAEVVGSSPQDFAAMMKTDMAKWGKLIKDAGIRAD